MRVDLTNQGRASPRQMSALPPIATAKADSRKRSCPHYPESGRVRRKPSCLLCARSGLMHRSKNQGGPRPWSVSCTCLL